MATAELISMFPMRGTMRNASKDLPQSRLISMFPMRGTMRTYKLEARVEVLTYIHVPHAGNNAMYGRRIRFRGRLISMFPMRGTIGQTADVPEQVRTYIHVPHAGNNIMRCMTSPWAILISMFPMRGTIWSRVETKTEELISMFPMRGTIR